jgi:hypothetical protein
MQNKVNSIPLHWHNFKEAGLENMRCKADNTNP